MKLNDTTQNLCDYCEFCPADCSPETIEYGNGYGNDNVIECDAFYASDDNEIDLLSASYKSL